MPIVPVVCDPTVPPTLGVVAVPVVLCGVVVVVDPGVPGVIVPAPELVVPVVAPAVAPDVAVPAVPVAAPPVVCAIIHALASRRMAVSRKVFLIAVSSLLEINR